MASEYTPGPFKLVRVEWLDPRSEGGWIWVTDSDETFNVDLSCWTVGWIVKEDSERLMVAGSLQKGGNSDQYGDLFVIPKCVIKEIITLCPSVDDLEWENRHLT